MTLSKRLVTRSQAQRAERRLAVRAKHRAHSKQITQSDFGTIVAQAEHDGRFVLPAACDDNGVLLKHPAIAYSEFADKRPVPKRIELWLHRFPTRGGLYLTGALSGYFAVDCDSPAAIRWLVRMGIPLTQIVKTRRGWHVYFRWPNFTVRNSASKIHPGVDIRGVGGVTVAVGSVHESGFVYQWRRGHSPRDVRIASAPKWLLDSLRKQNEAREAAPASGPVLDTVALDERGQWFETKIVSKFTRVTGRTHDANFITKVMGLCPAHDDHNPSGWAGLRPDGSIHLGCSSGCEFTDLLNAFGVTSEALAVPITTKEKLRLEADTLREFAKADAKAKKVVKSTKAARDDGFMSVAEMLVRKYPPEKWMVDGMLLYDGFSMLAGQPKFGKSTDARNLALCTARGIPFLGRRTDQVRTLYLGFEENPAVMTDHFKAMGARGDDLLFARAGLIPADNRIEWIEEKIIEFNPKMVILDPLSQVIRVEDWSAYGGMTAALEPFILMGQKYHCHVCIVHHESKGRLGESSGNKVLGSTALYGSVETLISVSASRGYFSIESSQRTGTNLPPTALAFDKATGIVSVLGNLREVTTQDVLAQLHEFLAKHGGSSGLSAHALIKGIGARRGLVLDALRRGVKTGFLIAVGTGKRGSSRTYRAKILSASSAALNGNGRGPGDGYLGGLTQTAMVAANEKVG